MFQCVKIEQIFQKVFKHTFIKQRNQNKHYFLILPIKEKVVRENRVEGFRKRVAFHEHGMANPRNRVLYTTEYKTRY